MALRAVLLAAGLGTRLRPLTEKIPKCLVPIHGKPLLDYWLEHLTDAGIDRVLINTHWLAQAVRDYLAASTFRDIVDLVHEEELLGTGGTVLSNRAWLSGEPFLLAHADNLTDFNVAQFVRHHELRPAGCVMSMLCFRTDDPRSCGVVGVGTSGILESFHEKVANPPGNLANAAVYICEPEVTTLIGRLGKPVIDFSTEVIPAFIGRILTVETAGYHRDIGTLESVAAAHLEYKPQPRERSAGGEGTP